MFEKVLIANRGDQVPLGARSSETKSHRGRRPPGQFCRGRDECLKKVLIANRGEIALRISAPVANWASRRSSCIPRPIVRPNYVKLADESVCIGPAASALSYLNVPAIISAAEVTDAQAIHPGYGFLSKTPTSPSASKPPASSSSARAPKPSA